MSSPEFTRLCAELDQLAYLEIPQHQMRQRAKQERAQHVRRARVQGDLRKSLSNLNKFGRQVAHQAEETRKRDEAAWLERIADGIPTEGDLTKAFAVLDAAIGKLPASQVNAMDAQLRGLQAQAQQETSRVMAKSITADINLPAARAQLDDLWATGKINGVAYRTADFHLRQLEATHA